MIVIIGSIFGLMVGAKTYIENAQVQKVIKKLHKFETSRVAFKQKYNCTPGDCLTASTYDLGTNGDGDGYVTDRRPTKGSRFLGEIANYWLHLSAARLLGEELLTNNIPPVGISDAYFTVTYENSSTDTGNKYALGATMQSPQTINRKMYPWMVFSIDEKIDDGMPTTGIMKAYTQITINATGILSYGFAMANNCAPLTVNPVVYNIDAGTSECIAMVKFKQFN